VKEKILYIIALILLSQLTWANTIEVCKSCEIKTIQAGIDASHSGDRLIVNEGLYLESALIISHPLDMIAKGEVIIDGEHKETILSFQTDSFSIDGFKLINVGHSYTKDFSALLVKRAKRFTIRNLEIEKAFFGILIERSKYGLIENNKVSSNAKDEASSGNGIHVWHSSYMTIRNNELFHLRDGIYFEFVKKSHISNNLSYENVRYGLHFMFSNNNDYEDNTFINNGAGVAVMFSKFINMRRNTFKDNWGPSSYGLLLKEIYDAEIVDNIFLRNTTGITAEGSTRINYHNNEFSNNGWSLKISGACYQNIFFDNNFLNNSFDLSYNGQLNDNEFKHNYWSAYTGYDLDKDGIGDIPFRPVKLFSYIVNHTPETIVLLRSLFVDIINFSEKVSPVFTPDALIDEQPMMKPIK